jgi:hypothetical protein
MGWADILTELINQNIATSVDKQALMQTKAN